MGKKRVILSSCAIAMVLPLAAQDPSALFDAVRNNDLNALRAGLHTTADANARNAHGVPLVMQAAAFGSLDALRMVIDGGAEVNAKNSFDATALLWAAGDPAKARLLLERGADAKMHSKQGRTPLMVAAAQDGGAETVRLLLEAGADPNAKDSSGTTALLDACNNGNTEGARLLVEKGAEANAVDRFGGTALMNAAGDSNFAVVKFLLAKGANANAVSTDAGRVKFGKIQLIGLTPLILAAAYGSPQLIKTLLDAGAKVNVKDCRGMTPLMLAVASETQDAEVVRLLLKAGAEINARSEAGETPLDWALKFGNRQTIAALRAAGARTAAVYTPPERKPADAAPSVPRSVEKSVALLQRVSTEFFKQSGCVGCHHQPMTALAVTAARAAGYRVDEGALREQLAMLKGGETQFGEVLLQRIDGPAAADIHVATLAALHEYTYPPDGLTDTVVANIAAQQRVNGSWVLGGTARPPMEESNIARTARAAFVLKSYAIPGRKVEFDGRISLARTWLLEAGPKTNDDFAMRLLGLLWTGADKAEIGKAARAVAQKQRPDGGWAQNANLASDALATGESLYALREAGAMKASDPAYAHGVKFLLDTQFADGSWYVRSRAPKFQPYFQSGFPYDHDQWISATATSWAVAALAPAGDGKVTADNRQ